MATQQAQPTVGARPARDCRSGPKAANNAQSHPEGRGLGTAPTVRGRAQGALLPFGGDVLNGWQIVAGQHAETVPIGFCGGICFTYLV